MLSIGQLITAGLLKFVWIVFIQGPLLIVSYVADAIKYLTQGILWNVFFDTNGSYKNGVITPPSLNDIKISWVFIGFVIIAIFIGLLVFIWQIIKITTTKSQDTKLQKQGIINAIKFFVLSFFVCFSIPALFFMLIAVMGFLSEAINLAFTGSSDQTGIADFLYLLGAPSGFNGPVPSNFAAPDDSVILNYNILIEWLGSWFALFALLVVSWIIMLKTAELFFLMIISPFLAFTMPLDDGKRIVLYKNMVISKALVILGNLVMYYVYIILMSIIHSTIAQSDWFNANGGSIAKAIVELAFVAGSTMAVFAASSMIATFIGESFGMREGMDAFRGFVGLMGGGGLMGFAARKLTMPFRLARKGYKHGNKLNVISQKMKHDKIDKKMSDGKMSETEGALAHEKVGKHFWRKKKLNEMQNQQHALDQKNGFKNDGKYHNSSNPKGTVIFNKDRQKISLMPKSTDKTKENSKGK